MSRSAVERPLRIGVEATQLGYAEGGGTYTFIRSILEQLERLDPTNEYFLYTSANVPDAHIPTGLLRNPRWHVRRAKGFAAIQPTVWVQTGFPSAVARDEIDVLWLTRHIVPLMKAQIPMVATVHDVIHARFPHLVSWQVQAANRLFVRRIVRSAGKVVAVSHATAKDLMEVYGLPASRLTVAQEGVDRSVFAPRDLEGARAYVRERYGVNRPFILALDVFNPRKNFTTVLQAYQRLPADLRANVDVVVTGLRKRHAKNFPFEHHLLANGLKKQVHQLGYLELEELPLLYTAASLLVFPSYAEGFGLPVLEAMACGCPVVASSIAVIMEVTSNAALVAAPDDVSSFARHMERVLKEPPVAQELRRRGLQRAERFSWFACARVIWQALLEAVQYPSVLPREVVSKTITLPEWEVALPGKGMPNESR